MLGDEEMLFDEYKRVDNICRDMFLSRSGVSQYITEMEQNSFRGRSVVLSWDGDYRRLKRVRWLRNQIAHESFATDCNEEDVAWLEEFHSRLLERQDPLALLEKTNREQMRIPPQRKSESNADPEQRTGRNSQPQKKEDYTPKGNIIVFIGIAAAVLFLIFYWMGAV